MAQPVSSPITSTPSQPGQPYSAVDNDTATPPWRKLPGGSADIHTGRLTGTSDWPSDGKWQQT